MFLLRASFQYYFINPNRDNILSHHSGSISIRFFQYFNRTTHVWYRRISVRQNNFKPEKERTAWCCDKAYFLLFLPISVTAGVHHMPHRQTNFVISAKIRHHPKCLENCFVVVGSEVEAVLIRNVHVDLRILALIHELLLLITNYDIYLYVLL